MTSISTPHHTATIHQFPIGGRRGLALSGDRQRKPLETPVSPSQEFAATDAWYHQEAIRDAQQATKQ